MSQSVKFSGKLATVLVAAGCSVGLGNIWRFPYVAGESGGGAFLLLYLLCTLVIGYPIVISEFAVGRATGQSPMSAYRTLGGRWKWLGFNGVLAALVIMGFYTVVAGWTAEYFVTSVSGELATLSTPAEYKSHFEGLTSSPWLMVLYTWIFVGISHAIIYMGVQKGLERVANILMPTLFIILIVLCVNSLTLPNSWEGVKFFLYPDFSKLTPQVFLSAMGQAFFSLSLGSGALVAYGAYIPREANLRTTTLQVMGLDTAVAILAGLIIFPATMSAGVDPTAGPALVFETLPAVFNTLPFSGVWASIFFLLLMIAALTSTMSLHEVLTVFFMEEFSLTRDKGAIITSLITGLLATAATLSLCIEIDTISLFAVLDFLSANIILPIGGMLTCIFTGWRMDRKTFIEQVTSYGTSRVRYIGVLTFLLKYICPIAIAAIFADNLGIF